MSFITRPVFRAFDAVDSQTNIAKSANAINREAPRITILPPTSSQIGTTPMVNENIQVKKTNPDDAASGALVGGGNTALALAPLGLRGLGGAGRTTILGA